MSRIEIYDTGRLLSSIAHDRDSTTRRRLSRISVPLFVVFDLAVLFGVGVLVLWVLGIPLAKPAMRMVLPIRIVSVFIALVFFRAYSTVWARAMFSNYLRLMLACMAGTVAGTVGVMAVPNLDVPKIVPVTLLYFSLSFILISMTRVLRSLFRDIFYAIGCSRLKSRRDVSRVLVYGAGLRYRAFRRELVRNVTENTRIIVGIIDDDKMLHGQYIGGIKVLGPIDRAREIIDEVNADSVVIACELDGEKLRAALELLADCKVKTTYFSFSEKEV